MKKTLSILTLAAALLFGGCASLQLQPADFSWAAEEIVDIGNDGMVSVQRYATAFNVQPLIQKEFGEKADQSQKPKSLRVIRDKAGYYYIVGKNFKNVYVFGTGEGSLKQESAVNISQTEMQDPKFNFNTRTNTYELWNGTAKYTLSKGSAAPVQGGVK